MMRPVLIGICVLLLVVAATFLREASLIGRHRASPETLLTIGASLRSTAHSSAPPDTALGKAHLQNEEGIPANWDIPTLTVPYDSAGVVTCTHPSHAVAACTALHSATAFKNHTSVFLEALDGPSTETGSLFRLLMPAADAALWRSKPSPTRECGDMSLTGRWIFCRSLNVTRQLQEQDRRRATSTDSDHQKHADARTARKQLEQFEILYFGTLGNHGPVVAQDDPGWRQARGLLRPHEVDYETWWYGRGLSLDTNSSSSPATATTFGGGANDRRRPFVSLPLSPTQAVIHPKIDGTASASCPVPLTFSPVTGILSPETHFCAPTLGRSWGSDQLWTTPPVDVLNSLSPESGVRQWLTAREAKLSAGADADAPPPQTVQWCRSSAASVSSVDTENMTGFLRGFGATDVTVRFTSAPAPSSPTDGASSPRGARVFPHSYSIPASLIVDDIPAKGVDCAPILPRTIFSQLKHAAEVEAGARNGGGGPPHDHHNPFHHHGNSDASNQFANQTALHAAYGRAYYCVTHKKGGWDAMRHYEIIAAGCMPFFVDIDSVPEHTLTHLPKRLLREARDLPGVHFDCVASMVRIDHSLFPHARYEALLRAVLAHARQHLTTEAMARYVMRTALSPDSPPNVGPHDRDDEGRSDPSRPPLASSGNKGPPVDAQPTVMFLHGRLKGYNAVAHGSYSSWSLAHGLFTVLGGAGRLRMQRRGFPFLFKGFPTSVRLYGGGFSYARMLDPPSLPANATTGLEPFLPEDDGDILAAIASRTVDAIIIGNIHWYATKSPRVLKHRRRAGGNDPLAAWPTAAAAALRAPAKSYLEQLINVAVASGYARHEIVVLIDTDVPCANYAATHVALRDVYLWPVSVLQREIGDCDWFVPARMDPLLIRMCVALKTRNCFDDTALLSAPFRRRFAASASTTGDKHSGARDGAVFTFRRNRDDEKMCLPIF